VSYLEIIFALPCLRQFLGFLFSLLVLIFPLVDLLINLFLAERGLAFSRLGLDGYVRVLRL